MDKANEVTLYKNHKNDIGYWKVYSTGNIIHMLSATTMHGSPIHHTEEVKEGKQGRSTLEQVAFRINSRINNKLDNGYVRDRESAEKPPTNALDLAQPMLAKPLKDVRSPDFDRMYTQMKFNGHRCLVTRLNGKLVAYSRRGKWVKTIDHILSNLNIPEGVILDGELYLHNTPLQTIASYAKRLQPATSSLLYVIYDVMMEGPFKERLHWLQKEFEYDKKSNIKIAKTWKLHKDNESFKDTLLRAKSGGFEGIILRDERGLYSAGRRPNDLIKVKSIPEIPLIELEFVVVDVIPSRDGWGILVCQLPNGDTFKTSAPGNMLTKKTILENKELFIGKEVTVEFPEYTKDGVPFHAVATGFREDI